MLSRTNEQSPKQAVARLRDPKFRVGLSRISLPRPQANVRPHLSALPEAVWIADGQNEGQGGEIANPADCGQKFGLRIFGLRKFVDLLVVVVDGLGEVLYDLNKRLYHWQNLTWNMVHSLTVECGRTDIGWYLASKDLDG